MTDETETLLLEGADQGDLSKVKALLDLGVEPNPPSHDWGCLARAAYHGHTDVVRLLLESGGNPDQCESGTPVLILAANMGRVGAVRELLAAGADVNRPDECNRQSALTYAVRPDGPFDQGHLQVVTLLLTHGANPNQGDGFGGRTPLAVVHERDLAVTRALLEAGAEVNARDESGLTPLMWAAWRGHTDNVELLLQHSAEVNARSKDGTTALMLAARGWPTPNGGNEQAELRTIRLLLEKGADWTFQDGAGRTAFAYAEDAGQIDAARILRALSGS